VYTRQPQFHTVIQKMSAGNSEFTAVFFDESSRGWMENKKRVGQGYAYICSGIYKNGNKCNNAVVTTEEFCRVHLKRGLKGKKEALNK